MQNNKILVSHQLEIALKGHSTILTSLRLTEASTEAWLLPFLNPVFFPFLSQVLTPEFLTILLYTYLYIRVCVLANSACENSALYFKKEDEIKTILRRTKIHTIKEILRNAFRKKNVLRWKNEHLRMTDDYKYCK